MNKQITKLDKQAKIWAMENTNYPISTYIPPGYTEKLAEFIVRECADFVEQDQGYGEALSNRLKKHFGIE